MFDNYCITSGISESLRNNSITYDKYKLLIDSNICPSYVLKSDTFFSRCLPAIAINAVNDSIIQVTDAFNKSIPLIVDNNLLTTQTLSNVVDKTKKLFDVGTTGKLNF
jgi:hypothetical protein